MVDFNDFIDSFYGATIIPLKNDAEILFEDLNINNVLLTKLEIDKYITRVTSSRGDDALKNVHTISFFSKLLTKNHLLTEQHVTKLLQTIQRAAQKPHHNTKCN